MVLGCADRGPLVARTAGIAAGWVADSLRLDCSRSPTCWVYLDRGRSCKIARNDILYMKSETRRAVRSAQRRSAITASRNTVDGSKQDVLVLVVLTKD